MLGCSKSRHDECQHADRIIVMPADRFRNWGWRNVHLIVRSVMSPDSRNVITERGLWCVSGYYRNNGQKKHPLGCPKYDVTGQQKCYHRPRTVHAVCIRKLKKKVDLMNANTRAR